MSNETATTNSRKPDFEVATENNGHWCRIGAAWHSKNGSISIRLDALPLNGQVVLFPPKAAE